MGGWRVTAKRIFVSVIVVGLLALAIAFVMLWYPIAPRPPAQADLDRLESRFPALQGTL